MNENVLIIVESIFNDHTVHIAKSMANTLKCQVVNVDKASRLDINHYKVIGWGSGIYFGKHHTKLLEYASRIPEQEQKAFVFCTHGNPRVGKYQLYLSDILRERGREIIGEFDTVGFDGTGPFLLIDGMHKGHPNESDCKKASQFVAEIMPEYITKDLYLKLRKHNKIVEGKSNVYQVEGDMLVGDKVTVSHKQCNGCRICLTKCPLHVFDMENDKAIPNREMDCIYCGICQRVCEHHAIFLHGTKGDYIRVAVRHKDKHGL